MQQKINAENGLFNPDLQVRKQEFIQKEKAIEARNLEINQLEEVKKAEMEEIKLKNAEKVR